MDDIKNYLMNMDGVLLRGTALIPGAAQFVQRLQTQEILYQHHHTPANRTLPLSSYLDTGIHCRGEGVW